MSEVKRFKRDPTSLLERLPNELLIEIFAYLTGVDAVYAFSQLNIRFQRLLLDYCYTFDFKSVSKAKFDFITRQLDPRRWRLLRLSDSDNTPGQIVLFCQCFPLAEYVSQLHSLSLLNLIPKNIPTYLSQIESFKHLVSLSLGSVCGKNIQSFELPSLKRLGVSSCRHGDWMMNFHQLESLEHTIEHDCYHEYVLAWPSTLERLKVFFRENQDGNAVRALLRCLPRLTSLSICDATSGSTLPNGQIWEELIASSLPLLKKFQFYFHFHCSHNTNDDINRVVASFSTSFYLEDKCWYVQCDATHTYPYLAAMYSLPFSFKQFEVSTESFDASISTLFASNISDAKSDRHTHVKTLVFCVPCSDPKEYFFTANVAHLVLKISHFPFNWLSQLTRLRELTIWRWAKMRPEEFVHLLKNAPNLHSLTTIVEILNHLTEGWTNQVVCDQLSHRIRSLHLVSYTSYRSTGSLDYVSVRQLHSIAKVFGPECEHLSFRLLAHPNTVRPILRRMRQLRSLHIKWKYSSFFNDRSLSCWLQSEKTGSSTDLDSVNIVDDDHIYTWFGNRL